MLKEERLSPQDYDTKKTDLQLRIRKYIYKLIHYQMDYYYPFKQDKIGALRLCLDEGRLNDGFVSHVKKTYPRYNFKYIYFGESTTKALVKETYSLFSQKPEDETQHITFGTKAFEKLSEDSKVVQKHIKLSEGGHENLGLKPNGLGVQYQSKLARLTTGLLNANGRFEDEEGEPIWCRQIAKWVADNRLLESDKKERLKYENFSKSINQDKYFQGNYYDNKSLMSGEDNYLVVDNNKIGDFIESLANKLAKGESAAITLGSENHLMSLHVEKRAKDGTIKIKFYDPNQTYSYKNALFNSPKDVKTFDFRSFLGDIIYDAYFATTSTCIMRWNGGSFDLVDEDPDEKLSEKLWFYCRVGCGDKIETTLNTISKDDLLSSFFRKRSETSLDAILGNGFNIEEAINCYFRGIVNNKERLGLSLKEIRFLLLAKHGFNNPAPYAALMLGGVNSIEPYIKALYDNRENLYLSTADIKEIALRYSVRDVSAAVRDGHVESAALYIKAFKELGLTTGEEESLRVKVKDIKKGFESVLRSGNAEHVSAYIKFILENEQELGLFAKEGEVSMLDLLGGSSKLYSAPKEIDSKVVGAYIKAILDNRGPLDLSGADVIDFLKAKGASGETWLHAAIIGNNLDVAKSYIDTILNSELSENEDVKQCREYKLDLLSAKDSKDDSLMIFSVKNDKSETAKQFIECLVGEGKDLLTVDVFNSDLYRLIKEKQEDSFCKYIRLFYNQSRMLRRIILHHDSKGITLLHQAVSSGCKKAVEMLIEKGADVNAVDDDGKTPLHCAVESGNKEIVDLLIKKGADVNAVDDDGKTPLHCAVESGNKEIVDLLIKKGADVNAVDNDGKTPNAIGNKEIKDLLGKHKQNDLGLFRVSHDNVAPTEVREDGGAESPDTTPGLIITPNLNYKPAK